MKKVRDRKAPKNEVGKREERKRKEGTRGKEKGVGKKYNYTKRVDGVIERAVWRGGRR